MRTLNNVYVWDVDETLGSFGTLDGIIQLFEIYIDRKLSKEEQFLMLDIFPEVLRPNIVEYLKLIKKSINTNNEKMIIYTNNVGPNSWVDMIKNYLEFKAKRQLFDKVIRAYKIDDTIVEKDRTDYSKNYNDLLKCMNTNKINNVCFIDDQSHELFNSDHVDGLHIPPYYIQYEPIVISSRLLDSVFKYDIKDPEKFINFIFVNGQPRKYFNPHEILYSRLDDAILLNHLTSFVKRNNKRKQRSKTRKIY